MTLSFARKYRTERSISIGKGSVQSAISSCCSVFYDDGRPQMRNRIYIYIYYSFTLADRYLDTQNEYPRYKYTTNIFITIQSYHILNSLSTSRL